MEKIKKIFNINAVIQVIVLILLFILALKKGGFYISDSFKFNIYIIFIGIFSIIYNIICSKFLNKEKYYILRTKEKKIDYIFLMLLVLTITYLLPIIFLNVTSFVESMFEFLRYLNILLIYIIVKNSSNKKLYVNSMIGIIFILCLFGIDQISGKYMLNILKKINSGYLSLYNVTRMSSVLQYANVFALVCLVCYFIIFDRKISFNIRNKYTNLIYSILSFTFLSSLILSGSRYTMLLMFVVFVAYILKNKEKRKAITINYIFDLIFTLGYSGIINNLQYSNVNLIYLIYIICLPIYFIIQKYLIKYIEKLKLNKYIKIALLTILGLYIIIGGNVKVPIYLEYGLNDSKISRNIYNIDKTSKVDISLETLEEDTRYVIDISKIKEDNNLENIKMIYYFSSPSNNYNLDVNLNDTDKGINILVTMQKGKLKINDISINGKSKGLNYLLLPTEIIYRIKEGIHFSNSFLQRIYFAKDAMKIVTSSNKNFIFGVGGEGFKNLYKQFRTYEYNSTEVHNVYIQIFVESGIIGFLTFIILNILFLKKSDNKLLTLIFVLHFIFELDFSYMFIMIFYIIIMSCNIKGAKKEESLH